jgi:rRNA processing protein Gar1
MLVGVIVDVMQPIHEVHRVVNEGSLIVRGEHIIVGHRASGVLS